MEQQVIFGTSVLDNRVVSAADGWIHFPGKGYGGSTEFAIDNGILSKHLLLLGGSGCGKTNTFFYLIETIREKMTENDVAIIFDTKGEFHEMFHRDGDIVIGNSPAYREISNIWNIFEEITADGDDPMSIDMNAREIANALFHDRGSTTQPFFANAARDIFRGILLHFIRQAKQNPSMFKGKLNNKDLMECFHSFKIKEYRTVFEHYDDTKSLNQYFGDGSSNQALGVFAELQSMLSDYFVGIFAEKDDQRAVSMRQAVRAKGGKFIFVEYDLSVGETLSPLYRLLVDQALKEALSRSSNEGNVYFIADEFKLLPKLQHIDDALNFGRGLGVKVAAGIQSIDQLYDIYGKDKGSVLAGGFGSMFAYHTSDASSREYITRRFGTNILAYEYASRQRNTIVSNEREGNTVEEWDQINLGVGQAIIGIGYKDPFLFYFEEYKTE